MLNRYWITWTEWKNWTEEDFGDKGDIEEAIKDILERKPAQDLAILIMKWLTFKRIEEVNCFLSNPQRESRTYMECLRNISNDLKGLLEAPDNKRG
jgi:hypothetical protein